MCPQNKNRLFFFFKYLCFLINELHSGKVIRIFPNFSIHLDIFWLWQFLLLLYFPNLEEPYWGLVSSMSYTIGIVWCCCTKAWYSISICVIGFEKWTIYYTPTIPKIKTVGKQKAQISFPDTGKDHVPFLLI